MPKAAANSQAWGLRFNSHADHAAQCRRQSRNSRRRKTSNPTEISLYCPSWQDADHFFRMDVPMFKSRGWMVLAGWALASLWLAAEEAKPVTGGRDVAQKLLKDGNFNDALHIYRQLAVDPKTDAKAVGDDLTHAVDCLANLGRIDEADALIEASVAAQPKNWRLLRSAAQNYQRIEHFGFIIAGKFERGGSPRARENMSAPLTGTGSVCLQLLEQAVDLATGRSREKRSRPDVPGIRRTSCSKVRCGGGDSWKLQVLTDLTRLPDYEEAAPWGRWGGCGGNEPQGVPVDADGNPVFLSRAEVVCRRPKRRRALAVDAAASRRIPRRPERSSRFSPGAIPARHSACRRWPTRASFRRVPKTTQQHETGPFAVHTLKDNETIAKLATGIKRFHVAGRIQLRC